MARLWWSERTERGVYRLAPDGEARRGRHCYDTRRECGASSALKDPVVEELRAGRISKGELRDAFGFAVLNEVDGFLKACA